mgnify:CR=1 FL=1
MASRPPRRRRIPRLALAALLAGTLLLAALALTLLPLPLAWAFNHGAQWILPVDSRVRLRADEAVLRWRWGEPEAEIAFAGLTVGVEGRPLATFGRGRLGLDKRAAWRGRYLPRWLDVEGLDAVVDVTPTGAVHALASAPEGPATPGDGGVAPTLLALSLLLPDSGGEGQVQIRGLRTSCVFPGLRWELNADVSAKVAHEPGGAARLAGRLALAAADGAHVIAEVTAVARPEAGVLEFDVRLPPFRVRAAPSPPDQLPPTPGTVALSLQGSVDAASGAWREGRADLVLDRWLLPLGPGGATFGLDRAEWRGRWAASEGGLTVETEKAEVAGEGAAVTFETLDAWLGAESRVRWKAGLRHAAARRFGALLSDSFARNQPWVFAIWPELVVEQVAAEGEAVFQPPTRGGFAIRRLSARHELMATVGGTPLRATLTARPAEQGGVAVRIESEPFALGRIVRLLPAHWSAARVDAPLRGRVDAHFGIDGRPRSLSATLDLGAGTWSPWPEPEPAAGLTGAAARVEWDVPAGRWVVHEARWESALGRMRIADLAFVRDSSGWRWQGAGEFDGVEGKKIPEQVRRGLDAALAPLGIFGGELGLDTWTFRLEGRRFRQPDGAWQIPTGEASALGHVRVANETVPVQLRLMRSNPGEAWHLTATAPRVLPAELGARLLGLGLKWSDLDVPLHVDVEGQLADDFRSLQRLDFKVDAGAGALRLGVHGGALPIRRLAIEGGWRFSPGLLQLSRVDVEVASGVEARVRDATFVPASGVWSATVPPGGIALADVLAAWPAGLWPETRARVAQLAPAGRLEHGALALEIAAGADGAVLRRAHGEVWLREGRMRIPGAEAALAVREARVELDYPRVRAEVRDARVPGASVVEALLEASDLGAGWPRASVRADLRMVPAEAGPWIDRIAVSDTLRAALGACRPVAVNVAGELRGRGRDFTGTQLSLAVRGERWVLPGIGDGVLAMNLTLHAPSAYEAVIRGTAELAGTPAAVAGFVTELSLRDWERRDRLVARLEARADAWQGVPLRLQAEFEAAPGGEVGVRVTHARLGGSTATGSWRRGASSSRVEVGASRLDFGELFALAAPWWDLMPPRPVAAAGDVARAVPPLRDAAGTVDFLARIERLDFGAGRRLEALEAEGRSRGDWLETLRLRARDGSGGRVATDLEAAPARQLLRVAVDDLSELARTLSQPLRNPRVPALLTREPWRTIGRVPELIAGGAATFTGEIRGAPSTVTAQGSLRLERATLLRPPRFVQLLALRRGRTFERDPLLKEFVVDAWTLDNAGLTLAGVRLEGGGLVDRLKLSTARYAFAGHRIAVDGEYFGVGFEVVGTRADPQVFLKDGPLLRALILQPDSGFFNDDASPAPRR